MDFICFLSYIYNHLDSLSSPDIRAAIDNIHKCFVVVPINKATGNIALICKRFYASVIAEELELGNNNSTKSYNSINNLQRQIPLITI